MYDIIIIGGGPIGSRVAYQLAVKGHKVLVLEKREAVGLKPCCTGIISQECVNTFSIPPEVILHWTNSARLFSPNGDSFLITRPETKVCIVDRPSFDRHLAAKAQSAGAEYLLNTKAENVSITKEKVTITANGQIFESKAVVLATGFSAPLVKELGLGRVSYYATGAQAEVDIQGVEDIEVYLGQKLAPGFFAWLVPTTPGKGLLGLLTRRKPGLYLRELMSQLASDGKLISPSLLDNSVGQASALASSYRHCEAAPAEPGATKQSKIPEGHSSSIPAQPVPYERPVPHERSESGSESGAGIQSPSSSFSPPSPSLRGSSGVEPEQRGNLKSSLSSPLPPAGEYSFTSTLSPGGREPERGGLIPPSSSFVTPASEPESTAAVEAASFSSYPIRYAGIPLKPLPRTYGNRLLVVGDAAGQVKPTTGGGLYFGLLCADLAADTLHNSLIIGRVKAFSAQKLSVYEKAWRQKLGRELRVEYFVRRCYERLSDRFIDRLFSRIKSNGIADSLLQSEKVAFDWHGGLILKALRRGAVSEAKRLIRLPLTLIRK